jgi:putative peptidoglycan lipid II flippase
VIALLFQYGEFDATSTEMTSFALTFHAVGLFAIAATRVFQQVFYAYKDMKTPTIAAGVVLIANIILCVVLSIPLSHGGIALAGSIAAAINGLLLVFYLRRKIGALGGRTMVMQFLKVTLATLLMTAAVLGFEALWAAPGVEERVFLGGWIMAVVMFASFVYVLASKLLRISELAELVGALRRRGTQASGNSESE